MQLWTVSEKNNKKKIPEGIHLSEVLTSVVSFIKILKALKCKYVLRMIYSSAHNGLAKLWFESPNCLSIYANSARSLSASFSPLISL